MSCSLVPRLPCSGMGEPGNEARCPGQFAPCVRSGRPWLGVLHPSCVFISVLQQQLLKLWMVNYNVPSCIAFWLDCTCCLLLPMLALNFFAWFRKRFSAFAKPWKCQGWSPGHFSGLIHDGSHALMGGIQPIAILLLHTNYIRWYK